MKSHTYWTKNLFITILSASVFYLSGHACRAADHGDAPGIAGDQGADLADVYFFLDPNDNTKVILIGTLRGFIVPGEAVNFGIFDPTVLYRFEFENTGDAVPDLTLDVTFSERTADPGPPGKESLQVPKAQTATITLPNGVTFTAPVLNPSLGGSSPAQTVTTNAATGVQFFAGEVDDPFFFDIPGFGRFIASVRNGAPDPSQLTRGRDTFAGYNDMAIAFSMPVSLIKGAGNVIGVDLVASRSKQTVKLKRKARKFIIESQLVRIDRMGNPGVNVALLPFNRKDAYNAGTTQDDAAGVFANDIVGTLTALGTNMANIDALAGVAITHGDFLHLDVSIPNTGTGGGTNPAAAFPNGRRLQDDVIDTFLFIVTNGAITTGDSVNANDQTFNDTFPFLALTQQPRTPGTIDDSTRN